MSSEADLAERVLLSGRCVTDWMVKTPVSATRLMRRAPWKEARSVCGGQNRIACATNLGFSLD